MRHRQVSMMLCSMHTMYDAALRHQCNMAAAAPPQCITSDLDSQVQKLDWGHKYSAQAFAPVSQQMLQHSLTQLLICSQVVVGR